MGKSHYIPLVAKRLNSKFGCITIPLHGPNVSNDLVMDLLERHDFGSKPRILHIDIAPNVSSFTINGKLHSQQYYKFESMHTHHTLN